MCCLNRNRFQNLIFWLLENKLKASVAGNGLEIDGDTLYT